MQKIVPNLWFENNAEEAVNFYLSVFKDSEMGYVTRYGESAAEASGQPAGSVLTISFRLFGQEFIALNGGPVFKFTEAVSFMIQCEDQAEIDYYWEKLGEGGDPAAEQCGWLKDRYGLSWQIVPAGMDEMIKNADPERSERMMKAMLEMKKIDIRAIEEAGK